MGDKVEKTKAAQGRVAGASGANAAVKSASAPGGMRRKSSASVGAAKPLSAGFVLTKLHLTTDVPVDVLLLVAGVDVQPDRLECEIIGLGAGEECWGITYAVLDGKPSNQQFGGLLRVWLSTTSKHAKAFKASAAPDCQQRQQGHQQQRHARGMPARHHASSKSPAWRINQSSSYRAKRHQRHYQQHRRTTKSAANQRFGVCLPPKDVRHEHQHTARRKCHQATAWPRC